MLFTTKTELPTKELGITHATRMILIGSCFAGNIGKKLQERKFPIEPNSFGVQYNPLSISVALRRIAAGEPFNETSPELFEFGGKWHSIMHHSDFSRNSKTELLEHLNGRLKQANAMAKGCDIIIVTFGTAYTYTRNSDGIVAGNCHKLPAKEFSRRLLGIEEIAGEFDKTIEILRQASPGVKFIFTVSPIRHLRDGAHDNQKSKATLLLAIDRIMERHPDCCHYFPAYEILLDELRDYRFYAEDMAHPSAVAVEYIWECFAKCYFDSATISLNKDIEEIVRGMSHRPFDQRSDGYRSFVKDLLRKITVLQEKHPYLDFKNEFEQCNTLLDK